MNAVKEMVRYIYEQIPRYVLERAFPISPYFGERDNRSLDARIAQEVIHQKVIPDLNILGGETVHIIVNSSFNHRQLNDGFIIEIPYSQTQGRSIVQAWMIEIANTPTPSPRANFTYPPKLGGAQGAARILQKANEGLGVDGITRIDVNTPNSVFIPMLNTIRGLKLMCVLEHDSQLMNIKPRYFGELGDFAVLAAKVLIYTKLNFEIGEGSVNSGSTSPQLRNYIDGLADAAELYSEKRRGVMKKLAILSDSASRQYWTRLNKF